MFWPTDTIFKYVYYANTLTELFEKFAFHERRALRFEDIFTYGVQGTGIHLFNNETMQYELWLGGTHIKTVSDVMEEVKSKNLSCPTALEEEYKLSGAYDVFLSHKSTNYKAAKMIYDYLSSKRKKVFLSEVSLPALSNADYTEEINDALCNCQNMVVLVNSIEDVSTGWIKYEWSSFLNEKNSGRKSGNIVTVVMDGIKADELPFALRQFEVISFKDYEKVINYLDI